MTQYRIQERKCSSNIIERKIDDGKWIPYIAPLCSKDEGDDICNKLLTQFEENEK